MDLLWFLLIGLVAGWLAGQIMQGGGYGVIGDMVVGCLGALVGGFLFSRSGFVIVGGYIDSIIVATLGAIILLLLMRFIRKA